MPQRHWTEKNRLSTPWLPKPWLETPTNPWSLPQSSLSRCRTSTTIHQSSFMALTMRECLRCPMLVSVSLWKSIFVSFFSFSMCPRLTACSLCIIQKSWNLTLRKWVGTLVATVVLRLLTCLGVCACVLAFACVHVFVFTAFSLCNTSSVMLSCHRVMICYPDTPCSQLT